MKTFGDWLKTARKKAGLTQTQAGAYIGKQQGVISDIERGMGHNLTREEVETLADCLGLAKEEAILAAFGAPPEITDPYTIRIIQKVERFSAEQKAALITIIDSMAKAA